MGDRLHLGLPDLREDPVGTIDWPAGALRPGMMLVVKVGEALVAVALDTVKTVKGVVLCEARVPGGVVQASADVDAAVKVVRSDIEGF